MSKSEKAARSVLFLIILAVTSKFLGLIRDMLMASNFGASIISDTFFLSNTVLILITTLITHAINTTMIPVLSKIMIDDGISAKNKLTNNILHIMVISSSIVVIISWIFTPFIINIFAPGFDKDQLKLMIRLIKIGLPSIILSAIAGVYRGYLHSEFKYSEASISDLALSVINIVFLLLFSKKYGIETLMIAIIVSGFVQIFIQSIGLKTTTYRYRMILNFKDRNIKKITLLTIPVLISTGISDLNKIIDKIMASILPEGSISALNYANKTNTIAMGIFITSIITVIYPMLSDAASRNDMNQLKAILRRGINSIFLITFPTTVIVLVFANPIIKLLFERGAFDSVATNMTAESLFFYSFALTGMALRLILIKVFYSLQDTKTPLINGIISSFLNVGLNFILIRHMAHKGLALATSISSLILTVFLLISITRKIGSIDIKKILFPAIKILLSSLIMGIIMYLLVNKLPIIYGKNAITNNWIFLVIVLLGIIIYGVLICLFKIGEAQWLLMSVVSRLKNKVFVFRK